MNLFLYKTLWCFVILVKLNLETDFEELWFWVRSNQKREKEEKNWPIREQDLWMGKIARRLKLFESDETEKWKIMKNDF